MKLGFRIWFFKWDRALVDAFIRRLKGYNSWFWTQSYEQGKIPPNRIKYLGFYLVFGNLVLEIVY